VRLGDDGRGHVHRQRTELHGQGDRRAAPRANASFFGYVAWSGAILLPLFALVSHLFFRGRP
jgi:hypothetical protein